MPPPPLPRLVLVLQRTGDDVALASWGLENDNAIDVTPGVPGIADALAYCSEYEPDEGAIPMAGVLSVFGRSGVVTAALNDYIASLIGNDSGVSGATVAAALDALDAAAPSWPGTTKAIANGGPVAPSGGILVNTGLFVAPPAGQWSVYQVSSIVVGRVQGTDAGTAALGEGFLAFGAGPGTPDVRITSGAIQQYAPAVPPWALGVMTCTAAGELLIGLGNNDAINAQTFSLLTVCSGPIALP